MLGKTLLVDPHDNFDSVEMSTMARKTPLSHTTTQNGDVQAETQQEQSSNIGVLPLMYDQSKVDQQAKDWVREMDRRIEIEN